MCASAYLGENIVAHFDGIAVFICDLSSVHINWLSDAVLDNIEEYRIYDLSYVFAFRFPHLGGNIILM